MTRWLHPDGLHTWRWRALTVWVVAFTAVVAILLQQHHAQTQRAERLAVQSRLTNARQQATLVDLCNRGYIQLGLIESALDLERARYKVDMKHFPAVVLEDIAFIRTFQTAHAQMVDQLTSKDSPCVNVTK